MKKMFRVYFFDGNIKTLYANSMSDVMDYLLSERGINANEVIRIENALIFYSKFDT